jgi:uncharacterized protein YraI
MRMFGKTLLAGLFGALAVPAAATAQTAVTTTELNLRAGPSNDFPVVTTIPDDARVRVHGCIARYSWCDVSWDDERGWAYGAYLTYPYRGRYVVVSEYGDDIDLPIISYSVGTYWDRYYRSRPWYSTRSRWVARWRDDDRRSYRSRDRAERREFRGEGRVTERQGLDRDRRVDRDGRDRGDRDRVRRSESREGRAERTERFNRGDRPRQADRGMREQRRESSGGGFQGRADGGVRGGGREGRGGGASVGGGAGVSGSAGGERGRDRR